MTDDGVLHNTRRTFGKIMEALLHDTSITDGAIRLYAHMHWRYGQNKKNWEGQRSMAQFLGVSEKTISSRIRELEQNDWVAVVLRGYNPKTGGFQTPYYHIFEDRADCIAFRQEFEPQKNEKIRDKAEARVRKLRKGAGNKHAKPPHQQNSSSDGQQNSSSDDLESVDLDSVDPDSEKNVVREEQRTVPAVNESKNKPTGIVGKPRDLIFDLIESLWQFGNGGRTAKVKKLLGGGFVPSGNAKDDRRDAQWIAHNVTPGMDEREIAAFGQWYTDTHEGINMPEKPDLISTWVHRFRRADNYRDYYPVEAKQESQNAQNVETPEQRLAKVRRAAELTKKPRRKYDKL